MLRTDSHISVSAGILHTISTAYPIRNNVHNFCIKVDNGISHSRGTSGSNQYAPADKSSLFRASHLF